MIEINLVPDVKQQLIRAQRIRNSVISISLIAAVAGAASVVVLSLYVFGFQTVRSVVADGAIKDNSHKLSNVQDISKTLTIQNQLAQISSIHEAEHINSRVFDVLTTANLPDNDPGKVTYSNVTIDTNAGTVTIQGQTPGYNGLDAYTKTLAATKLQYKSNGQSDSSNLASNITVSNQSFGQNSTGANVLTFSLTYTYAPALLSPDSTDASIVGLTKTNATDSYRGVPNSLFTSPASGGGK